jgi:hypothetical protein
VAGGPAVRADAAVPQPRPQHPGGGGASAAGLLGGARVVRVARRRAAERAVQVRLRIQGDQGRGGQEGSLYKLTLIVSFRIGLLIKGFVKNECKVFYIY